MSREYKDSGIAWISQVPKEWKVVKLRNLGNFTASGIDKNIIEGEELVHIVNYVDVYKNNTKELRKHNYMVVSAPQNKCVEHQLYVGDMIYTPSSETVEDIGLSSVVMEELPNTAYSYHVLRFRSNDSISLSYKKYITNNHFCLSYFSSCATGTIRKTISRDVFRECKVLLPPLHEQQKIADYLDKVCGEVDEMISLQEQMIEELKAYKQSVITEAVTKGRNPNVPMKDSGIDWIGEIPEHWKISRLKYFSNFINGFAFSSDVFSLDKGCRVIRIGDISQSLDFEGCVKANVNTDILQSYRIKNNDIVIAMSGATTGKCCIAKNVEEAYINQRVGIIRCDYYSYVYYSLQADYFMEYINLNNAGSAQPNVSGTSIGNFPLLVPSAGEQQSIASYLDEKCKEIDSLIALKEQKIEELKEYKKSVIYEYVTGKREVC